MRKFFCLSCDFVWNDLDYDCCPDCKSTDVMDDGDTTDIVEPSDFDGHFEGDFPQRYLQDDTGE
jgi:hypothetical protein